MKISVSKNNSNKIFETVEVKKVEDLINIVTKKTYSPSVYANNERLKKNFIETQIIGVDIDEGIS